MFVARRSHHNPILVPDKNHYWEAFATFNMSVVKKGKTFYGIYRAISMMDVLRSPQQVSTIGIGKSMDGTHFENRVPFITPDLPWEQYGCEDPRVTFFEGKYYIFYTALSKYPFEASGIKVAVAVSKNLKKVDEKHLVTPFNGKAMTLFPERINGKVVVIFSAHTDSPPAKMAIAEVDEIAELWNPAFWDSWEKKIDKQVIDLRRNEFDHVEVGAPPIKTKDGWLVIYLHIQNYFSNPDNFNRIFGIEAVLLDLNNPRKIIGRTRGPILAPRESYEMTGFVDNVVFPSGTMLVKDMLTIYYGAADTTVCSVHINLDDLIGSMHPKSMDRFHFKRFLGNPIISPKIENPWEAQATFNPAAIYLEGKTHILYRALSGDHTSTFGYAALENGTDVVERLAEPVYVPREDFENKKIDNANSGCEDPRLTQIRKNIYVCYTAFDSVGPPRVAISSITEKDFLAHKWNWEKPFLITPQDFDDKDTCLFPEHFPEGYLILHRVGGEICGDYLQTLDFKNETVKKCIRIIGSRINMWDNEKVGITAPPVKTKYGWLLLYHGISKSHHTYRVGALLLDLKDPAIVLARSTDPIFEPEEQYEKVGIVNNVVFPCGMVVRDGLIYIYYGGADKVVGVATMELDVVVNALLNGVRH
ncbi:hypothetical protein A3C67_01660 [Candidatus Nomurabacteria bacterium RIFCSPHIGHO2_02_FULL_42_19]|uniref:Glycosidase n=1 Tax=Candidatus Nomurabacteria bacterium RIFCSPHIGHO2_02_FULL_42_19 TaxID=1801756 RepID=A0A1F6W2K4_9BACT|nr:MAG: hypothetical protein A3C67_01660 [Candidatus Nomurabacteria bacterium RIFCSPHIGHO2_02_FULL_42_19]